MVRYALCFVLAPFILLGCLTAPVQKESIELPIPDFVSLINTEALKEITAEDIENQILKANNQSWIDDYIDKDFLTGHVNRQDNSFFIQVDKEHTERNIYLIRPVYEAYKVMHHAALADGVKLVITSGHRTFIEQVVEWELRWNNPGTEVSFANDVEKAKFLLQYRAMPGTTRHHWGTDIDLNSFEISYYETREGQKMFNWLKENAAEYGFFQPYTVNDAKRPKGYKEEKWHWSYKPLSQIMLTKYIELVEIEDISGFKGEGAAKRLPIVSDWVCGINPQLFNDE
ncbi:MAG: M15 family metallopeptidase [Tannerella sp.]|jgi:LAS superfamily LD-carboxypeptidase LdcB|nr:M15 family metallopeptidase [Tannerella sp.]